MGECPATQEAIEEAEQSGELGCPLCGRNAEDHLSEGDAPRADQGVVEGKGLDLLGRRWTITKGTAEGPDTGRGVEVMPVAEHERFLLEAEGRAERAEAEVERLEDQLRYWRGRCEGFIPDRKDPDG